MLENLLNDFGYLALFIGTFLEGETILVLAGLAAAHDYLDIKWVIFVAFIGSYAGDQLWYFLGRRYGITLLNKKPKWRKSADKALVYLKKYPDLWVLSFRFMYGLRTVMPVAIGLSGYPVKRYILLNGIGAIVWAIVLGGASYYFGAAIKTVLNNIKDYELYLFGLIIIIGTIFWIRRYQKNKKALTPRD